MRSFTHAWLDEDELQAVIDYHTAMIEQAIDSCEYQEANNRRDRITLFKRLQAKQRQKGRKVS
jgi:hypothetical protein